MIARTSPIAAATLAASLVAACGTTGASAGSGATEHCPLIAATPADELIQPDEKHFAHLWQLTHGGQNAEGYWNFAGDRLSFQHTADDPSVLAGTCDRIYVTDPAGGPHIAVSNGHGVTTCSYFLPDGEHLLYASTHLWQDTCPPKPDYSKGYTWVVHPEYDIFVQDLESGGVTQLTNSWGYDAEATISPLGDRIVFTSTRSGDLELWTSALDGSDLFQVTHHLGYDGGAFFSHDGKSLVFRSTCFTPGKEAQEQSLYRELLAQDKVRPQSMEIMLIDVDGSDRRQVTHLGGANFAPYFYPGDKRILFATNHHEASQRNFDLFAIDTDGKELERITTYSGFDCFPMFSPDGKWLAFASNRGGKVAGETNLFIARWK